MGSELFSCHRQSLFLANLRFFSGNLSGKLVATKTENNPVERFRKPIITNFYLFKDLGVQKVPCGVERYDILAANYDNAGSAKGMFETMEKARYSRKYDGKDPSTLAGAPDLLSIMNFRRPMKTDCVSGGTL